MPNLLEVLPTAELLLALEPEELAGVLIEVIPGGMQNDNFHIGDLTYQVFPPAGNGYPGAVHRKVVLAIAEAVSWLENQGVIIQDPNQPADRYTLTRRGRKLRTRVDVGTFRRAQALPLQLLPQALADKVHHLFLRGDHDTAVFQAFKEIEIAVRKAAALPETLVGRELMTQAFNPQNGPLRDNIAIAAEREAEMFLFAGAMGHAKNPTSHRDLNLSADDAARLIVFASHLLKIVEQRAAMQTNKT
jgi:uncharacterized protein (TIGR02391 family)